METSNKESTHLVTEEQLKTWTQYSRTKDLLDFLRANGITYFRGRGGSVMTTIQAVNAPLKVGKDDSQDFF
ncbi:hypothetical protein [Endozoicomonas sp. SCSIO W0465]|uniref:hypothetical protein n=1 Tax=Endozoicomonas sp. SCSIO W0465 TaxID=2918516 RepID=UPI0020764A1B|nr:hypothetical protein [Endozoicomonas sp. SCSIO W0465]USE34610.1 hypothetical protein MJO57_21045 [Endozoicomonas sp. SCSIO W0465]